MFRPTITKLDNYYYDAFFQDVNYAKIKEYYSKYKPILGGCSVVINGNLIGRNYDWKYDNQCVFRVETPATASGRHHVIGNCGSPAGVTQDLIGTGEDSDLYSVIPGMLLDGVNDAGLYCNINVVPSGDYGYTTGTNPDGEDLFALLIPRYVLDFASSVDEAVALLRSKNIFCPHSEEIDEEFHFILKDSVKTVVVEFIQNVMVVVDSFVDDLPIITNFYLYNYDGTRDTLTDHAQGIERHSILSDNYAISSSKNGMFSLMKTVEFTKAYDIEKANPWYSEFSANYGEPHGDLTKDSTPEEYAPVMAIAKDRFDHRERNGLTWQTVYTAIYDLDDFSMVSTVQEGSSEYSKQLVVSSSILNDVKEVVLGDPTDNSFDKELIMQINTCIADLRQIGLKNIPYRIVTGKETWEEFLSGSQDFEAVKTYIVSKVHKRFDPPASSIVMQALTETISECEWRIREFIENGAFEVTVP